MVLDSYFCVMCIENVEEDFWHLFFCCPFSDACLTYLGIQWDSSLDFQLMVLDARQIFGLATFREIFILGCWSLWCHRNDIIFDAGSLTFSKWRAHFVREMNAVTLGVKPQLAEEKIHSSLRQLL
jgi:hypothetical protein